MPSTLTLPSRFAAMRRIALLSLFLLVPGAPSAQQASGLEYRIGPEDVLHISVWKEEDLDRKVLVRPDGGISFPLAGDIQVSGRTPLEVQDEIRSRLQRYLPDAEVTVAIDKISGYTIFVLGEVNTPGQFTLGRYIDVMQALTLAGAAQRLTPVSARSRFCVVRMGVRWFTDSIFVTLKTNVTWSRTLCCKVAMLSLFRSHRTKHSDQ